MSRRVQLYLLGGLVALLAVVLYFSLRGSSTTVPGVFAADSKFAPLDVQEPQLKLDLLEKLRGLEYSGTHRNIFLSTPPPPPVVVAPKPTGPPPPPVPPPLQVPAEYFGYATQPRAGRHVAFLTSGEDVLVVVEGDTFLNRFRLVHVGNESLDVEEISTHRHATLPIAADQVQSP
jgi:hypothetical protein